MSEVDTSITTDNTLMLYAAGFDQYGNYRQDESTAGWTTTGGLVPVLTDEPGASVSYQPTASDVTGTIQLDDRIVPAVTGDETGTINVGGGTGSDIRITYSPGGNELGDSSFVAGDTLRLFASQFDGSNNFLGLVEGDWTISPATLGRFENGNNTITDSIVRFQAYRIGSGNIQLSFGGFSDVTGLLTVNLGAADSIVIRDQANGGGTPYRSKTFSMTTDSTITLYAAHYDAMGNFRNDSAVTWDAINETGGGLTPLPAGPASQITFSPSVPGTGQVVTTSPSLVDDTSGVITVNTGALDYIVIQDASGAGGNEIESLVLTAGDNLDLYASGYDADSNYVGDQSATWTILGDPIGSFTANPASNTTLQTDTAGNAQIRAVTTVGGKIDVTGNIQVDPGTPTAITLVAGDDQSGPVAQQLPVPLQVLVQDAFGNPVPNTTVQWVPTLGGFVSSGSSLTDAQGIAETDWTLHDTTSVDTVISYISGVATTPDTLYFRASPEPASGLVLSALTPTSYSGQILTQVGPYRVEVQDSLNNPVSGVRVGFAIVGRPAGSQGESLTADTVFTNASGMAETNLVLGSRLGTYTVRAFANASPSAVDFTGIADMPGDADSVIVLAGNNQTGTVGQLLIQDIRVRLVDAYLNPLPDSSLIFDALTGAGTTIPDTALTDANGDTTFSWTLDTLVGLNELVVRVEGSAVISDTLLATANRDAAANVSLVSIRGIAQDSLSAVANGSVSFTMEVTDQYGNSVPDEVITSEIFLGNGAQVTDQTSITNSNGRFVNSLLIDPDTMLTVVRSLIANVDTALAHVYRISYAAGSLDPPAVALGTGTSLSVKVNNPGPYPVSLNTGQSNIYFSDGTQTYQANLNPISDSIQVGIDSLEFLSSVVNTNFIPANYQPRITLQGSGGDSSLNGNFLTGPGDLRLYSVQIASVTKESPAAFQVRRGDTLTIQMNIQNDGNVQVEINPALTTPRLFRSGAPVAAVFQKISGADTLLPNTTEPLRYIYPVPVDFTTGVYTVDGDFQGTVIISGELVEDNASALIDSFEVISGADVQYVASSLTPREVNSGDSASFSLQIQNNGQANVFLQASGTYLTFGTDTIYLNGNQTITGNTTSSLNFVPDSIGTAAAPAAYQPLLVLFGQENGADYRDTLGVGELTDLISVFSIPLVEVQNFTLKHRFCEPG